MLHAIKEGRLTGLATRVVEAILPNT